MKAVAIVGLKKSGKTTLIEELIRILSAHGKVGTLKHSPHHEIDTSGDTHRHRLAGADITAAITSETVVLVEPHDGREDAALMKALLELARRGIDFALVEGFKESPLPKVALGNVKVDNVVMRVEGKPDAGEIAGLIRGMKDYESEM